MKMDRRDNEDGHATGATMKMDRRDNEDGRATGATMKMGAQPARQ
jgi:predicted phosphoribosyltransferase